MIRIPLVQEPSQTLTLTLGDQPTQISLRTIGDKLYFTLNSSDTFIVENRVCRNRMRLLTGFSYRGYVGDFIFVDTQGNNDPIFLGLDVRYLLVYLENGE